MDIIKAHKKSIWHRPIILDSESCGCFYCLKVFKPTQIEEWTDFKTSEGQITDGQTALLCPGCGLDSVIGSASNYPITKEFLGKMHKHWFS